MFEKYKEKYTKFEAEHESARKVRTHLEKNGGFYLFGVGCFTMGYFLNGILAPVTDTVTDSISAIDSEACIWISDHLMAEIYKGITEITMESGEIIELALTGIK